MREVEKQDEDWKGDDGEKEMNKDRLSFPSRWHHCSFGKKNIHVYYILKSFQHKKPQQSDGNTVMVQKKK